MSEALLEFRGVSTPAQAPYDVGLRDVSFALRAGELAWVRLEHGRSITPLADVAEGLLAPDAGDVRFAGEDWSAVSATRSAEHRSRIGRVFERQGWISNLDVDENITLPQRYHHGRDDAAVLDEARRIAESLGLPGLPPGRPAGVSRQELRRAEWVRALMGDPILLLLERPGRELPAAWIEALMAEVQRRREQGLAVVWLSDDIEHVDATRLRPTLKFPLRGENMTPHT